MDVSIHHDPFAPDSDFEDEPQAHEQQRSGEPVLMYDKAKPRDIVKFLGAAPPEIAERVIAYESEHRNRGNVLDAARKRLATLQEEQKLREEQTPPVPVNHADDPETVDGIRNQLGQEALEEHERKVADVSS